MSFTYSTGKLHKWIKYTDMYTQIQHLNFAIVETFLNFVPVFCDAFPLMSIFNSMPSQQQQCLFLDEYLDKPVVNRDEWYVISVNWSKSWMKYTRSSVNIYEFPSPIDNNALLDGLILKLNLAQIIDYQPIPSEEWEELLSCYGLSVSSVAIGTVTVERIAMLFPFINRSVSYSCQMLCNWERWLSKLKMGRRDKVSDLIATIKLALKIRSSILI